MITISVACSNFGMGPKTAKDDDEVSLGDGVSETTHNDEVDQVHPLTIKERLASLDGAFPMDEAVVQCNPPAWPSRTFEIPR